MIGRKFFERDADVVAKDLLGKILIRKMGRRKVGGIIVETEAYFGEKDPASRAFVGKKNMNSIMWECPGTIFIYMVHSNWMLNFVTGKCNDPQAVLIRAIEPRFGIEIMKRNRGMKDLKRLTNGPGKLTKALAIDKSFNGKKVYSKGTGIYVLDNKEKFEIGRSHRIGVSRDLKEPLRFFIKGNPFVSRQELYK